MQEFFILGLIPGTNLQISFEAFLVIICGLLLTAMTIQRHIEPIAQAHNLRTAAKLTNHVGGYEPAPLRTQRKTATQ
jgi:hypothetical protein